mgnify:CR=1 FL=1
MLHSCYRRTGGLARVGEPDDRALSETAEGLREPEVGRSGEGGSSPGMGTRVRSPSTTKARGPGETTRRHGPRHVRARTSDEVRGSAPGDRLGAGRGLAQGEGRLSFPPRGRSARPRWRTGRGARRRLPRGRSAPGSRPRAVTGRSGWKSGPRACGGASRPLPWEPLTSPRPRTCAGASSGAAPSAHQPERPPRAVRVRLDAHRPIAVESAPAYAEADPSDPPHV